jgi:hypothetical protein
MAKVTAKTKAGTKKKPVKAGSSSKKHGGLPTQKLVMIMKRTKK